MSASCDTYTAYSGQTNAGGWENAALYSNKGNFIDPRIISARLGNVYNEPDIDKCCSVCSIGSYDGENYSFYEDEDSTIVATCSSFTLALVDDPGFGYYCHFFKTPQGATLDTD